VKKTISAERVIQTILVLILLTAILTSCNTKVSRNPIVITESVLIMPTEYNYKGQQLFTVMIGDTITKNNMLPDEIAAGLKTGKWDYKPH
jgi:hypothetical protein